jgi:hypothetical protein
MRYKFETLFENIIYTGLATFAVLGARILFYRIRDGFPARALFGDAIEQGQNIDICIVRMKDIEETGRFKSPKSVSTVLDEQEPYEFRANIPWVTSLGETHSLGYIFNVLGQCGKKTKINMCYADQTYDRWDVPMFLLGGSNKTRSAFATCNPIYEFSDGKFRHLASGNSYSPQDSDYDIGLLQKMISPATNVPVWVCMGWRSNGTIASAYGLFKYWRELGCLYGRKNFGILFEFRDQDGPQSFHIKSLSPEPFILVKMIHPVAWLRIKRIRNNNKVIKKS